MEAKIIRSTVEEYLMQRICYENRFTTGRNSDREQSRLEGSIKNSAISNAPVRHVRSISRFSSRRSFFALSQIEPERERDNDTVSGLHWLIFPRARAIRRIRLRFASRTRARTSHRFLQRDEAPSAARRGCQTDTAVFLAKTHAAQFRVS